MIKLTDLLNESINEGKDERKDIQNFLDTVKKKTGIAGGSYSSGNMSVSFPESTNRKKEIEKIAKKLNYIFWKKEGDNLLFRKEATESVNEGKRKKKPKKPDPKDYSGWQSYEDAVGTYQDELKRYNETVNETNSKTYFQTFSAAVQHAAEEAEKQGYQIDEDEWFSQIGTGGSYTRSRPSKGDTHRFTVGLLKRGKPARKALHIQVFGMDNGKYELNSYIN